MMKNTLLVAIGLTVSLISPTFTMQQSLSLNVSYNELLSEAIGKNFEFSREGVADIIAQGLFPNEPHLTPALKINNPPVKINKEKLVDVVKKSTLVFVKKRPGAFKIVEACNKNMEHVIKSSPNIMQQSPEKLVLQKHEKINLTDVMLRLNRYIRRGNFREMFTFFSKKIDELEDYPLARKLRAVLFKEIGTIHEFCTNLTVFPSNTGSMLISLALFARNQSFIDSYGEINDISPIMQCLLRNDCYNCK